MTVHMVRVLAESPRGGAATAIDNWVQNYSEWTADPVAHELREVNTELDGGGTTHLRGDWRFEDQGEAPTDILSDLSDRLQSLEGGLWHRLGYHVCDHDEDDRGGCEWDETVEVGSVPADVPGF